MGTFGIWELLLILIIVIALFGAGKIAGVGSALGSSIREFKKAVRDEDSGAATEAPAVRKMHEAELPENNRTRV